MDRRRLRSDEVRAARAARFAALLGDALYELGLTHKDVAQELGVPRYTVDSWTRADAPKIPGGPNLARLCEFLEARKPGLGRALASIAGQAWTSEISAPEATRPPIAFRSPTTSATDPRLSRPVAHPDLTNIPTPLTSFVGRESQIIQVREALASTRLLTLMGAGGIGKTRLALQVGTSLLPRYQDGVWLIELAALSDPALVPQVVATTLSVREQPGRPLTEVLVAHLRPRRALLILDNCEHLVEPCAALAGALLQACPDLRILATSREALRVPGEMTWRVPSLDVPSEVPSSSGKPGISYLVLGTSEAVQLFVERARPANPGFELTPENAPAVMQVCKRLDGVPLAIELAAACVRALSVEQVAARLDDRFRLLVAGSRLAMPRHQTLRAALDWSYDLLAEEERVLFSRLSVFPGGCTLDATEAVCTGEGLGRGEVLALLMQLVDKSLLMADNQGTEVRYRMLETIRAYAREKLEGEGVYDRLVEFFTGYVGAYPTAYDALDRETPNIVGALQAALDRGMQEALVRGANDFYHFLETRGLYALANVLLGRAEGAARSLDDKRGLAMVLLNMGRLAERGGDYERAIVLYVEGLLLARELGDKALISALLQNLGGVIIRQGDYTQAEAYLLEGLSLAREAGDKERISALLGNLGSVAGSRGDYAQAEVYCKESLELARSLGNRERMCALLQNLGIAASSRGDYTQAESHYQKSLALAREIGHKERMSHLLQRLGLLASDRADYTQAEEYLLDGLSLARDIENRERIGALLDGLGVVAGKQGDYAQAEACFDESLELARDIGNQRLIANVLTHRGETLLSRQQGDLAASTFSEALAIARELGSRDLMAAALYGLARASAVQGGLDAAQRQGEESLAILESIGHSGAEDVRQWLARLLVTSSMGSRDQGSGIRGQSR